MTDADKIVDLERYVADLEKQLDDLNDEVVRLARVTAKLEREYHDLKESVDTSIVKPLSEETPPPHY